MSSRSRWGGSSVDAAPIVVALMALAIVGFQGCGGDGTSRSTPCAGSVPAAAFDVTLVVHDEAGAPINGANVKATQFEASAAADGHAQLTALTTPTAILVSADGYLPEPVVVGPEDGGKSIDVRMLSTKGGKRFVMHSVGDVMLGRRYEAPAEGVPLIPMTDAEAASRKVFEPIRAVYASASFRTLNLETVVTDRELTSAYPGKRFILRTRPGALAGVVDLEADAIGLANNHQRDFLDGGVADTIAALRARNIPIIGASADATAPIAFTKEIPGAKVGVLAYTTVDGDFVNDSYPSESPAPPADLDPKDGFQYEARTWGFSGGAIAIPQAARRIGPAWVAFENGQKSAPAADVAAAWGSLTPVYPEMQDWVQRRGHGGALPWNGETSAREIAELRRSSDLVVVQLHAGFQFQEASGKNVVSVVKQAIDAGADIVIGHHPHVLQGLGFYKGKLVAFSLGNFAFDQDFLSTFASVMLRTVWEGRTMIEARLLPVEIDAYVPRLATGEAARQILYRIWERSVIPARSNRDGGGKVHAIATTDDGIVPAHLVITGNTARAVAEVPGQAREPISVAPGAVASIDAPTLCEDKLGLADGDSILVGRDLLGWGRFESELAGATTGRTHWDLPGVCDKDVTFGGGARGAGFLRLRRSADNKSAVLARPIARIPIFKHRLYSENGSALDPEPTFTVRLAARRVGDARAFVRAALYHFDDSDPTEDPDSREVGQIELDLPRGDGEWFAPVELPLTDPALAGDGLGNMVLLYIGLEAPASGVATLDIDDLSFVEWRPASRMTGAFGRYDFVKNTGAEDAKLMVPCLRF